MTLGTYSLTVPCPKCGAAPTKPCTWSTGHKYVYPHKERIQAAGEPPPPRETRWEMQRMEWQLADDRRASLIDLVKEEIGSSVTWPNLGDKTVPRRREWR
jgi:hypothetical protein